MELELDFTAFKKNLRDLIESRGLYAKDIAAEINVSTPTLSFGSPATSAFLLTGCWASATTATRQSPQKSASLPLCTLWPHQMTVPSSKLYSKNIERRTNHDLRQRLGTFCLLCRNRLGG